MAAISYNHAQLLAGMSFTIAQGMRKMGFLQTEDFVPTVWTVSELTGYIKELFEIDYRLRELEVSGEISNFTRARSGHLYFTLKDESAQLRCVMWRTAAQALRFAPGDGDAVVVHGRVSIYEAGGAYQLYADFMAPAGRGNLAMAFEELKERLAAEGLFDLERKRPLPPFPQKIGLVTSADAAALRDVLNVLQRRAPLLSVLLAPTLVQGDEAPAQIVRAMRWLDGRDDIDLIILARGGGSIEDLWAFNDEDVARAIFAARHPVITGVGHETDFTIADFVADLRAPTPSAAAELAVPDMGDLPIMLAAARERLAALLLERIDQARLRVQTGRQALQHLSPRTRLENYAQQVDALEMRMGQGMSRRLERAHARVDRLETQLQAVSPRATLARGYAIVRFESGSLVTRVSQANPGDLLEIQVSDGIIGATAREVSPVDLPP